MKTITFYHSILCPRCHLTGRRLTELQREFPGLKIDNIDVTRHPKTAMEAGVRMIPCLIAGGKKMSGIILSKEKMRTFINNL